MTKIFIATPAYSGTVHVQYAISLSDTQSLLSSHGIESIISINCSGSLLVAERNRLLMSFLDSDATHMLCIDSDLGWPAMAVKALIDHDVDFVVGVYPTRKDNLFLFRPVFNPDKSVVINSKGLIKMEYIPAGFMLLKREAVEKMVAHFPELYFKPKTSDNNAFDGYCLFNTEVWEGEFWGEDYYFCRKAREAGIEIWVDPLIEFDHAGVRGMLASVLTSKPQEELNAIN